MHGYPRKSNRRRFVNSRKNFGLKILNAIQLLVCERDDDEDDRTDAIECAEQLVLGLRTAADVFLMRCRGGNRSKDKPDPPFRRTDIRLSRHRQIRTRGKLREHTAQRRRVGNRLLLRFPLFLACWRWRMEPRSPTQHRRPGRATTPPRRAR